ncbi:MAG: hypothetical protein DWG79_01085 [Chloroflexi bacterium]|nr:hypothetical protein [Chloroflexota bacterium]MDA1146839.1 hypothetical protein [Chloroflexota bacterium]MQC82451.1 hypothetical protein [Chloroflexota bacterium]
MDGGPGSDVEAVRRTLRERDHALFRFETVPHRLLIDFRSTSEVEPAVHVLEPVRSLRERIATIRRVRPALPVPTELQVVGWSLRIGSLERLGLLEIVRTRLADSGAAETLRQLTAAIERLETLERDEFRRAITGEGYRTLWPARGS